MEKKVVDEVVRDMENDEEPGSGRNGFNYFLLLLIFFGLGWFGMDYYNQRGIFTPKVDPNLVVADSVYSGEIEVWTMDAVDFKIAYEVDVFKTFLEIHNYPIDSIMPPYIISNIRELISNKDWAHFIMRQADIKTSIACLINNGIRQVVKLDYHFTKGQENLIVDIMADTSTQRLIEDDIRRSEDPAVRDVKQEIAMAKAEAQKRTRLIEQQNSGKTEIEKQAERHLFIAEQELKFIALRAKLHKAEHKLAMEDDARKAERELRQKKYQIEVEKVKNLVDAEKAKRAKALDEAYQRGLKAGRKLKPQTKAEKQFEFYHEANIKLAQAMAKVEMPKMVVSSAPLTNHFDAYYEAVDGMYDTPAEKTIKFISKNYHYLRNRLTN